MVLRRRQEDEWTLQRRVDGIRLCMSNHGFVTTASDATAIESVDDDAWLVLESEAERVHRLVIAAGPSGLEYEWSINGRSEEFDAEAQEWRDLMLTVMDGYMEIQDVLAEEGSLRSEIGSTKGVSPGCGVRSGPPAACRRQVRAGHFARSPGRRDEPGVRAGGTHCRSARDNDTCRPLERSSGDRQQAWVTAEFLEALSPRRSPWTRLTCRRQSRRPGKRRVRSTWPKRWR